MNTILRSLVGLFILQSAFCSAQIVPPTIREADAMWVRRVWREIDLREKINLPLYYPTSPSQGFESLFDVLTNALKNETLTAYGIGPLGQTDDFSLPLPSIEVQRLLFTTDSIWTYQLDTGEGMLAVIEDSIRSEEITRYRIKEEWIFDRQRSVMDVRILGISPLKEVRSKD